MHSVSDVEKEEIL